MAAQAGEASGPMGEGVRMRGGFAQAYLEKFVNLIEPHLTGRGYFRPFGLRGSNACHGDLEIPRR